MDVRAKQRLCYRSCPLNLSLCGSSFAPRHLNRYVSVIRIEGLNQMKNLILLVVVLSVAVAGQAQTTRRNLNVEFQGNKIFSSDTLLEKLNFCIEKYSDSENKDDAGFYAYCLRTETCAVFWKAGVI